MAYTGIPSNPFTVPGSAAGFLDIRKKGTTGPVVTVTVPAYTGASLGPAYVYAFMPDQSNGSGLSPRAGLPAKYAHVDPRHLTWNDLTGQIETWQLGVNDNSINSRKWTDAATGDYLVPGYAASFGPDAGLATSFLADPAKNGLSVYTFKLWIGVRPGETVNPNSTTTTIWLNEFYPRIKTQWNAFKAALLAKGHSSVITVGMYAGLGEGNHSAGEQANYKADMKTLFQQMLADGVRQPATNVYLLAKQPSQYADILALQKELSTELNFPLLTLANPTYLSDGIHYSQESMERLGEMDYDPGLSVTGQGGGNATLPTGTNTNIAAPATTQVLNLRYNQGKATDGSSWTSSDSRALAVRQPQAANRLVVVAGGMQGTAGNKFMYSDSYNFSQLTEMSWVFYARNLVKSAAGNNSQSFVYNGDEDAQGAFSSYWDEAANLLVARVHSLASPAGNRSLTNYYYITVPFGGGDCLVKIRFNKSRATDCIRLEVNGVVGTVAAGYDKQPAFFLDGIVALFGRNEPSESSLRGVVQQVSFWNYELSDAAIDAAGNQYLAELPAGTSPAMYDVLDNRIQVSGTTYTRGGTDSWGALAGVTTQHLLAGADGGVRFQVLDNTDQAATLGLHKANQPAGVVAGSGYPAMDFCVYVATSNGAVECFAAGTYLGGFQPPAAPYDLYVHRKGNGDIAAQSYVSGQQLPVAEKLLGNYSGDLWHRLDLSGGGKVSNPLLVGFTA